MRRQQDGWSSWLRAKPASHLNVKTPLEATSESKHPSDLSALFFSLPHPSSPLHGHRHRLHLHTLVPLSCLNLSRVLTSPPFSPRRSPSSPRPPRTRFLSPFCSLTRLLAPTCHSNRLTPSLAPSTRRFFPLLPCLPFSLRASIVLVPFLLSLSRPSSSPSSSCFFSSPPCLSPL